MKFIVAALLVLCLVLVAKASELKQFRECLNKCKENQLGFRFCAKYCYRGKEADVDAALEDVMSVQSDEDLGSNINKDSLWQKLRTEVERVFTQGRKSNTLRMTTKFINAGNWDEQAALSQFCDFVPIAGPLYEYNMDSSWRDRYAEFVNSIQAPARKPNPEADRLSEQIDNLFPDLDIQEAICQDNWEKYPQFLKDKTVNGYEGFRNMRCNVLQRKQREMDDLQFALHRINVNEYGDFAELMDATLLLKGAAKLAPKWKTIESVANFKAAIAAGKTNNFEVLISRSTSTSTNKWSKFSADVSLKLPGVGAPPGENATGGGFDFSSGGEIKLSFGREKTSLTTSTKDIKIGFTTKGYQYFHVLPDPSWFKIGVISKYINYQYIAGKSKNYFFSLENGRLPLILRGFYMVGKPGVTLYVNQKDASEIKKQSTFGINFNYGPITVNVNSEKGVEVKKSDEQTYAVTLTSDSDDPQVWAADVEILDPAMRNLFNQVNPQ